jgi:hypothetical protein
LKIRKDFSQGNTSAFQKPIAQKIEKDKELPGPCSYDIKKTEKYLFKSNNVCADSAFKSNTKRDIYNTDQLKDLPAPNKYNINDDPIHISSKVPYYSSFKSTSQRHSFTENADIPAYF